MNVTKFFLSIRCYMALLFTVFAGAVSAEGFDPHAEAGDSIHRYREQLYNLEREAGHFSFQLLEALQHLADAQLAANRLNDAWESIDRAAHITRIEDGLYTPMQYPYLQQAIEIDVLRGEWEDVNEQIEHFTWLIGHKFQGTVKDRINRMRWIAGIHHEGFMGDSEDNEAHHLIQATSIHETVVQYAQVKRLANDPAYAEMLLDLARAYELEAKAISGGGTTSYRLRRIVPGLEILEDKYEAIEKRYQIGLEKLEMRRDLLAQLSPANSAVLAEADLTLARWHENFNKVELANTYFHQAELTRTGAPLAAAQLLFGVSSEAINQPGAD